jgi:O-antigen/teichoic acid export membrane protein
MGMRYGFPLIMKTTTQVLALKERVLGWVKHQLGAQQSVRRKTIEGSSWLFLRSIALGGVDLVRTMVFARMLSAYDYGVMALVTMATGFLTSFTFLGVDILIQKDKDDYQKYLPFYWTIKAVRGVLLASIAWFVSPLLAEYYNQPSLLWLIRFASLSFLFEGFMGFGKDYCQRVMDFGRGARYEILGSVVVLCLSLLALFIFKNYWAIAVNLVLISLANLVISYLLFPWKPSWRFSPAIFKKVLVLCGSLIAINALNFFFSNLDRAVIGKMFEAEQLGYYARANFLAMIPATYLATVMVPVFMPAFRQVLHDPLRIRKAFLKVFWIYSLFYILVGVGLVLFARLFVLIIYGESWLVVVPLFRVMAIYGVSKGIVSICAPVFFLKNKPWLITLCTFVMVGSFAAMLGPMIQRFELMGAAWSIVIAALLSHSLSFVFVFYLLKKEEVVGHPAP